ncbi:adenosylmethionine decarboxylase [Mesorhizobium sp. B1-1-5]|nr:adenosylmethionine decarboxylase [Mesorhizobium sp. B1-1-5]
MLFASELVVPAQRQYDYTVHSLSSGKYSPPLPTSEDVTSPLGMPGSLPGRHLIVELHDAVNLDDASFIDQILRHAAEAAKAKVLALHHHVFTPDGGVTAFAMLAESHISIHTWPVECYAAVDIFMCGTCNPLACLLAFATAFRPKRMSVLNLSRGSHALD